MPLTSRARLLAILVASGTALLSATGVASAAVARPAQAPACEKRVAFALADARTDGCLTKVSTNPDRWESTDTVRLNGIPLTPVGGTKLALTGPSSSDPGGRIAVNTTISLGDINVFSGDFSYKLPAGNPGQSALLGSLSPPAGAKIKGFAIGGSATVTMGRDAGADQPGYARFELVAKMPDVFKNGPGQTAGGLTGTVAIRTDAAGVHADTLKIELANAYVGQVLLKSVCLSYVAGTSTSQPCSPPSFGSQKQLLDCTNNSGASRWDGAAVITLPTAARPDLGLFAGVYDGRFAYGGIQATGLKQSVPIVQGVFLDKVGIGVCVNPPPFKIKGAVGIRFGPDFNGTQAAYLDASLEYVDSRPWYIEARGALALFGQNVANGYLKYQSSGAIDFGFNAALSFAGGLLDVNAGVNGWYEPASTYPTRVPDLSNPRNVQLLNDYQQCLRTFSCLINASRLRAAQQGLTQVTTVVRYSSKPAKFDVYGNGRVCAAKIVCTGGEVAVSSVGVAGCASITVAGYPEPYWLGVRWVPVSIRAGAGYRWGGSVDVMGKSCDVGGYRAQRSARLSAAGVHTLTLKGGVGTVLRLQGSTAPPKVRLTGPNGRQIVLAKVGALVRNHHYYVEDVNDKSTRVFIVRPAPGKWTITELPGSAKVLSISEAPVYPDARAAGRIRGTGANRVLEYAVEGNPDHTVTFWERGVSYERELGVAKGKPCLQNAPIKGTRPADSVNFRPTIRCGEIPFAPAPGPGGKREIVAIVTDHGEPVNEMNVATYTEQVPDHPGMVHHLTVTREGTDVTATWQGAPRAFDYDVDLTLADGEHRLLVVPAAERTAVFHDVPPVSAVVTVDGLRKDDVEGPKAVSQSLAA